MSQCVYQECLSLSVKIYVTFYNFCANTLKNLPSPELTHSTNAPLNSFTASFSHHHRHNWLETVMDETEREEQAARASRSESSDLRFPAGLHGCTYAYEFTSSVCMYESEQRASSAPVSRRKMNTLSLL